MIQVLALLLFGGACLCVAMFGLWQGSWLVTGVFAWLAWVILRR